MLVYCGQTVGWIKMKLGTKVGLSPGHIVLDGDPAPPPQRGTFPQLSAHVCCGQAAGWIKLPLGMKVYLGPGDIVLHGDPSPLPLPKKMRRQQPPIFGPCIVAKRLDGSIYATLYEGRRRPRRHCVRWRPSFPQKRGTAPTPSFWPTFIVAKRRPSQLLLSNCSFFFLYGCLM